MNFRYSINIEKKVLQFTIQDSGEGISEDYSKVIFDRFRRIEDNVTNEMTGLGLGLSITKAYVEMLGGEISEKSTMGIGYVFTFTIPLKYDQTVVESTLRNFFLWKL